MLEKDQLAQHRALYGHNNYYTIPYKGCIYILSAKNTTKKANSDTNIPQIISIHIPNHL